MRQQFGARARRLEGTGRLTLVAMVILIGVAAAQGPQPAPFAPLPGTTTPDPGRVELGRMLFFDTRLSGNDTLSCAVCHDPARAWTDGAALSAGYPGSRYFRNTPTLLNVVHGRYVYWDGRLPASDLPTVMRDHIAEAHFFQADGRLIIERLRQVPVYEQGFKDVFGGEPSYGRILNSLTAFVTTLQAPGSPFDRYLQGDKSALTEQATRGLALFEGKAGCLRCHDGAMLSDGRFHNLGLAPNPDIFNEPLRHITFRRFFRTMGLDAAGLREDPGRYAITKRQEDWGRFRTPTLREVAATAPYMHDGSLATLADVVDFYDGGGGPGRGKDASLKPLGLSAAEKADLVAFLEALTGEPVTVERPQRPPYSLRTLGSN